MIEMVLWDLGGVLCRFDPDARITAMAAAARCSERSVEAFLSASLLESIDRGELDGGHLLGRARDELGWTCSYEQLGEAWSKAFTPDVEVLALARRTRLPGAVLSNNGPPLMDQLATLLPEVSAVVGPALCSADLRATKPHVVAFTRACQHLRRDPAPVLLIDDSAANTAGAVASGMRAIRFRTAELLETELREQGLLEADR